MGLATLIFSNAMAAVTAQLASGDREGRKRVREEEAAAVEGRWADGRQEGPREREVSNFASEFKEHIRSGPGPHGRYDIFSFCCAASSVGRWVLPLRSVDGAHLSALRARCT
jgi:hypothetical protein